MLRQKLGVVHRVLIWVLLASGWPLSAVGAQDPTRGQTFAEAPSRKWTSADGKFTVQGKLSAIDGTKVALQLDNGKRVSIELGKLSQEDQDYVATALDAESASPFMEDAGDVAGPEGDSGFGDAGGFGERRDSQPTGSEPDTSQLSEIDLDTNTPLDLQASHWQKKSDQAIRPFQIKSYSIHADHTNIVATPDGTLAAVSMHDPFGGDDADHPESWVTLVDLKTGKVRAEIPLPSKDSVVGDLSADGTQLAIFNGQPGGTEPDIGVYRIEGQGLIPVLVWDPSDAAGFFKQAVALQFLANGDLVMETFDQLLVWQLQPLAAKFQVSKSNGPWQLASDRIHALVGQPGQRFEVDLVQGTCTGKESGDAIAATWVDSPDGQRRVRFDENSIILETTAREPLDAFYVPIRWPEASLAWLDDRFLQLTIPHRVYIVDTTNRVALAEIALFATAAQGGWVVESKGGTRQHLMRISRPDPQTAQRPNWRDLADTLPQAGEALLVLQPGDRVRLDIQLAADPGQTAEATRALRQIMAERELIEDPNAPLQLQARSSTESEQVEYRTFGTPPWEGGESVNVTRTTNRIALIRGAEVLWSHSSAFGPGFMLMLREGESAQQAANRSTSTGEGFWASLKLPRHVARHPAEGAWFSFHEQNGNLRKIR